jgi:soluble P-type ATPase
MGYSCAFIIPLTLAVPDPILIELLRNRSMEDWMIKIGIPGRGEIEIENIVFDVNGTIALDGHIDDEIRRKLVALTDTLEVFLLTADTYGTVEKEMKGSGITIQKIVAPGEDKRKMDFIEKIGAQKTITVGNGANDAMMLNVAALGVCVIAEEGASAWAIDNADIVVFGREKVFELLENPKRIAATLRQ